MKIEPNTARLQRFCGYSTHPILGVEVYVASPKAGTEQGILLNLEIHCGKASFEDSPDDEQVGWTKPVIEVWFPVPSLSPSDLKGFTAKVKKAYREGRLESTLCL